MQSQRTISRQKETAENLSDSTTDAPAVSMLHGATMPPTLWNSGRQSNNRSSVDASVNPANQPPQFRMRRWLMLAAFGKPVVPDV